MVQFRPVLLSLLLISSALSETVSIRTVSGSSGLDTATGTSCVLCSTVLSPLTLDDAGRIDRRTMDDIFTALRQDPNRDIKGVLVVLHGNVVAEAYFNGEERNSLHDMRSAGKSVTSTLVGIAIDQKLISGVDEPILNLLPASTSRPQNKANIKLSDVLTMRSGLAADDSDPASPGNENEMDKAPDWVDFAMDLPMKTTPGQSYSYAGVNAFLAGAIVETASRQSLDAFADQYLFRPIGITRFSWHHGAKGRVSGQGNLNITLRDMARIGELFLHHGMANGKQVVSRQWVQDALSSIVPISAVNPFADYYGYMWYTKTYSMSGHGVLVHFASGNGGNDINIIPDYDMVVVISSSAYGKSYGHSRSADILGRILAAVIVDAKPQP